MAMANLDRAVAEVLMRMHQDEWGPGSSQTSMQEPVSSQTINDRLVEAQWPIGHDTVVSILRDLEDQDFIKLGRQVGEDGSVTVEKVFPTRVKARFNLWHVAEDAF